MTTSLERVTSAIQNEHVSSKSRIFYNSNVAITLRVSYGTYTCLFQCSGLEELDESKNVQG